MININHLMPFYSQIYMKRSSSTLTCVDTLCTVAMAEFLEDSGRDPQSETFPTLNK